MMVPDSETGRIPSLGFARARMVAWVPITWEGIHVVDRLRISAPKTHVLRPSELRDMSSFDKLEGKAENVLKEQSEGSEHSWAMPSVSQMVS